MASADLLAVLDGLIGQTLQNALGLDHHAHIHLQAYKLRPHRRGNRQRFARPVGHQAHPQGQMGEFAAQGRPHHRHRRRGVGLHGRGHGGIGHILNIQGGHARAHGFFGVAQGKIHRR